MINSIKIRIDGLNSGKVINDLIDKNVYIENLTIKKNYLTFLVDEKNEKYVKNSCRKFHKKYKIVSRGGIKVILKNLKYFYGFALALFISTIYLLSYNIYVFNVNISHNSNEDFDLSPIENLLYENNIVAGAKRKDISVSDVQRLILETQENVSGCTVKQNGGSIDIIIYPGIIKNEVDNKNIYSSYNAVVTKIELFAGKTNLKVGDIVQVNDLLIENDNGASGNIYGKVYYSDYIIYNENQTEKVLTGNFCEKTFLMSVNKNLQKQIKINEFLNYFEEKCVFCISRNMFFPINYVKVKYLEYVVNEKIVEFETVENELKNNLYNLILEKIEDKSAVTNVTYSVVKENNLTRLDCFVECEINLVK